jgi:hypothetical protein
MTGVLGWEVQHSKLSVIFLCCLIVSAGTVNLFVEIAEEDRFAIGYYSHGPSFFALVPGQVFVF